MIAVDLDRCALDARDFAGALVGHGDGEPARLGPAQVHAQQHLRPVLRLRAAGAGLDVEESAARVHLAREHARELELADAFLELRRVLHDFRKSRFVAFRLDERQEFRGIGEAAAQLVEFGDGGFEPRAFSPQRLRLGRRVPDRRIRELVIQLFEALALRVVLKGTPSAPSGAP